MEIIKFWRDSKKLFKIGQKGSVTGKSSTFLKSFYKWSKWIQIEIKVI